jgi:hypothetical protein
MLSASLAAFKPRPIYIPSPNVIAANLFVVAALCLSVLVSVLTYSSVAGQANTVRNTVLARACRTPQAIRIAVCPASAGTSRSLTSAHVGTIE